MNVDIVVRRWRSCPLHVLEVYSAGKLRDALNLKDGDKIELEIDLDFIASVSLRQAFFWYLFWWRRETYFYQSDAYLRFLRKMAKGKKLAVQGALR